MISVTNGCILLDVYMYTTRIDVLSKHARGAYLPVKTRIIIVYYFQTLRVYRQKHDWLKSAMPCLRPFFRDKLVELYWLRKIHKNCRLVLEYIYHQWFFLGRWVDRLSHLINLTPVSNERSKINESKRHYVLKLFFNILWYVYVIYILFQKMFMADI